MTTVEQVPHQALAPLNDSSDNSAPLPVPSAPPHTTSLMDTEASLFHGQADDVEDAFALDSYTFTSSSALFPLPPQTQPGAMDLPGWPAVYHSPSSIHSSSTTDDLMDLANRVFMATCDKFARQGEPGNRRRSAYTFLQNWCIYRIYNKAQQILLGFSDIHPTVYLAGDDALFTPQFAHHQLQRHYLADWDDPEDMEYADGEPPADDVEDIEDGMLIVPWPPLTATATVPDSDTQNIDGTDDVYNSFSAHSDSSRKSDHSWIMDENAWMGRRYTVPPSEHDHTNDDHQLSNGEEDAPGKKQEMNVDEMAITDGFTMSPAIISWYRSAQYDLHLSHASANDPNSSSSQTRNEPDTEKHTTTGSLQMAPAATAIGIAIPTTRGYGSMEQIVAHRGTTVVKTHWIERTAGIWPMMDRISEGILVVHQLTEAYADGRDAPGKFPKVTPGKFRRWTVYVFDIWKTLFVYAELLLSDIMGTV